MPIRQAVEMDGSPEKSAQFSLTKHKFIDTEEHAHDWYGTVKNFRLSVTRIIEYGGTIQNFRIGDFTPEVITAVETPGDDSF
ncbi:hypothetical protein PENSOL_c001G04889 [Penicillium solitum]|uniref:Uncharacterized protein n=1 Tax=Penicillium solitum TaxID=60172 RepID=A0A1V6RQL3_9EURO|nr:uncharacterized protein PENSOL_c001G04889 [Penicillium solitum]OQE03703.1 hypothetical protein PENSOL_c001G04889 [Penicillium solitum]